MRAERILKHNAVDIQPGPVVYWMSRDQRVLDNWALLYAQQMALDLRRPLVVVFCLVPTFLGAALRQYGFMLRGLEEVAAGLGERQIPFYLRQGDPSTEIPRFVKEQRAGALVTDFDPLRVKRQWKDRVAGSVTIPFYEVDAHNIVPCWHASPKGEFGAYTLRPKIHRVLEDFLDPLPRIRRHPFPWPKKPPAWSAEQVLKGLKIDRAAGEVTWLRPGERAACQALRGFIRDRLSHYATARNDPTLDGQSGLSPYLHFGQLAAQRVALEVLRADVDTAARDAFLEELIVRRELADNFCYYNPNYDRISGLPDWARTTLDQHAADRREYLYSRAQLEAARTHDPLWNAAQVEMIKTGKMHGYLRMYWAKKILEWTASPAQAMAEALYLNDKYELDGRDPSGYAGVAWAIGGVHDRAWGERPVFGKIRYMNFNGCKKKFAVQDYIDRQNQG